MKGFVLSSCLGPPEVCNLAARRICNSLSVVESMPSSRVPFLAFALGISGRRIEAWDTPPARRDSRRQRRRLALLVEE